MPCASATTSPPTQRSSSSPRIPSRRPARARDRTRTRPRTRTRNPRELVPGVAGSLRMVDPRIVDRRDPARCAICHDALHASIRCDRCGTALHEDCARSLNACPTFGCTERVDEVRAGILSPPRCRRDPGRARHSSAASLPVARVRLEHARRGRRVLHACTAGDRRRLPPRGFASSRSTRRRDRRVSARSAASR